MKKVVFIAVLFIVNWGLIIAQPKGSVTKARAYLDKNDLINAKAEIDVAVTDPKASLKNDTWYAKGQIYAAIAKSEDSNVQALSPNALEESIQALSKVITEEKPNNPTRVFAEQYVNDLWGFFVQKGSDQYNAEDFQGAYTNFSKGLVAKPADSITSYYAGLAAQQNENYDAALKHYYSMIDNNDGNEDIWFKVIYIEREFKKNYDKALENIRKAKTAYPSNMDFLNDEINLLIQTNKVDDAKEQIKAAMIREPKNVIYPLNMAILFDNVSRDFMEKDVTKAIAPLDSAKLYYKKALELEPTNFIANYNLSAVYSNHAKIYYDEARNMDYKTYQKEGAAKEAKGLSIISEALPFAKKAVEVEPNDVDANYALMQVYRIMKMYDEATAVDEKIKQLENKE